MAHHERHSLIHLVCNLQLAILSISSACKRCNLAIVGSSPWDRVDIDEDTGIGIWEHANISIAQSLLCYVYNFRGTLLGEGTSSEGFDDRVGKINVTSVHMLTRYNGINKDMFNKKLLYHQITYWIGGANFRDGACVERVCGGYVYVEYIQALSGKIRITSDGM